MEILILIILLSLVIMVHCELRSLKEHITKEQQSREMEVEYYGNRDTSNFIK